MAPPPTFQGSTREQLIHKLNNAAEFFGLKLPDPARSILNYKKIPADDPSTKRSQIDNSSQVQPNESDVYDFNTSAKESFRFFVIRDRWAIIEREIKIADSDQPLPLVRMPLITRKEVENLLLEMFGREKSCDHTVLVTEESIHPCQDKITAFVSEVERTRIIAVNTESPQRGHEVNGEQGHVQIALAAFSGLVLKFSNPQLLPNQLKSFLGDVGYAKLGISPDRECLQLQQVGIKLKGWIHSGAVYRALLAGKESEYDVDSQIEFLESNGFLKSPERDMTNPERKDRLAENAWVPLAVTMASALNFAAKRGYPDDKQMFPVIWEAIDMVRGKVAEDLCNISSNPIENWIAPVGNCPSSDHQNVNSVGAILTFRRMSGDFVEVFDPAFDPLEAAKIPFGFFIDAKTKKYSLPNTAHKRVRFMGRISLAGVCLFCGGQGLRGHKCPERGQAEAACVYPHDNVPDLPPHLTRFCPVLHRICYLCLTRGHYPEAHANREFSQRELRERFFKFAHQGFYTSVPYLFLIPKIFEMLPLSSKLWRTGYQGLTFGSDPITHFQGHTFGTDPITRYRGLTFGSDPITRYQLGIDIQKCLEIAANISRDKDNGQLVQLKTKLVQQNADAESLESLQDLRPVLKDPMDF